MKIATAAGFGLLMVLPSAVAAEYIWPSKYDHLEDVFQLQSGYIRHGFVDGV